MLFLVTFFQVWVRHKIDMRHVFVFLNRVMIKTVVELSVIAEDLEAGHEPTALNFRRCDHSNFVNLLDYSLHSVFGRGHIELIEVELFPLNFVLKLIERLLVLFSHFIELRISLIILLQADQLVALIVLLLEYRDEVAAIAVEVCSDLVSDLLKIIVKIVDIPNLARNCDALSIFCPNLTVINQSVLRVLDCEVLLTQVGNIFLLSLREASNTGALDLLFELGAMVGEYQITADHDTGAAFASLTVHSDDISFVLLEPLMRIDTVIIEEIERRRVVIIEAKLLAHLALVEGCGVVFALTAKVVDLVAVAVPPVQEAAHLTDRIPIPGLKVFRRIPHGYYSLCDVYEIEVVALLDEALLFL
jgi:hypothetical protein